MRIARPILESNRVLRFLCGSCKIRPRELEWTACRFLVAGENGGDTHLVQHTGFLERLERVEHYDIAALHVDHPGTARGCVTQLLVFLERARWLEHRIEVTNQKQSRPAAIALRDQVTCASPCRTVHPPHLEADCLELDPENLCHLANAGEIHRAAVHVDEPLEQCQPFGIGWIDSGDNALLDFRK